MTEERHPEDPTLHPLHPGRNKGTYLITAEGEEPEQGGVYIFLPSGATKIIGWRQASPITPTLEAAKKYTATLIESLQKDGLASDIDRTNWVSVAAAIQRVILDFNDRIRIRIGNEMAKQFGFVDDVTRLMH